MSKENTLLVLTHIGSPIRTKRLVCESWGISLPYFNTLVEHWGLPTGPTLPGKPSDVNPEGRGRQTIWVPDVIEWYLQLAEQQGITIKQRGLFAGEPTPEMIAHVIERNGLNVTLDDGGE